MEPRPYQKAANEAVMTRLYAGDNNLLVVIPTGCGKSYVIADFCMRSLQAWPETRIVIATHSRDLVSQDYLELINLWPGAPAGVYSAGLNRRDLDASILFVGIQSVYNKAFDIQRCDVLLIDEAHTVSRNAQTMWDRFIADLRTINPHMRVIGLSATPYRLDSGSLVEGDDRLFEDIAYEYGILDAIREKYLCEVIPKHMETRLDVSGVHKRGGEFIAGELEAAVNVDEVTRTAVAEIVQYGANRGTWLCFCAGVDHSHKVAEAIRAHGIECAVVTGETPPAERDQILRAFKDGKLRAVANRDIMTTGTNVPRIDLIAGLRPTASAGLYVQMLGRGSRTFPGKENCLYLDHANNAGRFGPIDQIKPRRPGKGGGEAPVRVCDHCHAVCHAGARSCPDCGRDFPPPEIRIAAQSYSNPILSTQIAPEWLDVIGMTQMRHEKAGRPPSLKISYHTLNGKMISRWLCFEHGGFARQKAVEWHKGRMPRLPPDTVDEALNMPYPQPSRILVRKEGEHLRILKEDYTPAAVEPDVKAAAPSNPGAEWGVFIDEDIIPF
ncbi:DEAD/DEAH box helicase [Roseicella sp. DB1501]|uniref:DEAD/DEAH box helicase n=1 Tax=Roseicella sp. DB1501 TaxID=2730925 RepID=UPI0017DCEA87|nr:DEAD/DEAH box helicase [Roseicella sp. DB1501]NOG73736.1 DEAD/DEAH box helicase [Roseicella sp. DB1501]